LFPETRQAVASATVPASALATESEMAAAAAVPEMVQPRVAGKSQVVVGTLAQKADGRMLRRESAPRDPHAEAAVRWLSKLA
jgi:hypothetical protein